MTGEIATYLIVRDMRELGYKEKEYITTFDAYVCTSGNTVIIKGDTDFFYLIEDVQGVSILSDFGTFDLNDTGINKQQYVHQGKVTIKNNTLQTVLIKFIHVIPKNK